MCDVGGLRKSGNALCGVLLATFIPLVFSFFPILVLVSSSFDGGRLFSLASIFPALIASRLLLQESMAA